MGAIVFAMALLGLFVAIGLAFLWQGKLESEFTAVIYGVEDSLEWVAAALTPGTRAQLKKSDIRRILEHDIRFAQRAFESQDLDGAVVVGGYDSAVFVQQACLDQGHGYDGPLIEEVLERRADYMIAIGAVGLAASAKETAEAYGIDVDAELPSAGDVE
ncbi:MAG: hypothetical protein GXP36_11725 [Actinobacteria bacterium]|nr:hypothetical protein [Actinomycetota bacterium]